MFGDILQELRKDKGWTQADVAKLLGLSKSAVGAYEASVSEPSIENLIKISDLFNVNIDFLLGHVREQISWSDLVAPIKINNGTITISTINDALRTLSIHNRTVLIEHLMQLKRLEDLETLVKTYER